jgi:Fe-S cluster assembly ATP-binding protein
MLSVEGLHAQTEGQSIINGLNLKVNAGEVHAIMGPNGSGKSTLAKVLVGHPDYEVTEGKVTYEVDFEAQDLLEMEPHERAQNGVFLAFQYPTEIPGVSNIEFLRTSFNEICKHQGVEPMEEVEFREFLKEKIELVGLKPDFLDRSVNEGFSGGEKKKNEILQMAVLAPRLALLDETDSGLDIDALKTVANGVNHLKGEENAVVLVTHYQRLLDFIEPDFVHVLYQGKIVKTGDKSLALELEKRGYDWLTKNG